MATDAHVRALRFMGPILAEVLRARARHQQCGVAELAASEVSDYQDAILRGIQRTLDAGLEPPESEPPPEQRSTPTRPAPPLEPETRAPAGVYSGGARPPSQTGRTTPSFPPPPPLPSGAPFNDPAEITRPRSRRAHERREKGR